MVERSDRKEKRLYYHFSLFHKVISQKIQKAVLKGGRDLKGEKKMSK